MVNLEDGIFKYRISQIIINLVTYFTHSEFLKFDTIDLGDILWIRNDLDLISINVFFFLMR